MIILGIILSLIGAVASVLGFLVRSSAAYRMGNGLVGLRELPLVGSLMEDLDISVASANSLVNIAFFGGLFLFVLGLVLIIAGAVVKSRKGGKTWTCTCGAKVPMQSRFCLSCGNRLVYDDPAPPATPAKPRKMPAPDALCPHCGAAQEDPGQKFCINCGRTLNAPKPEPAPVPHGPVCPTCGATLEDENQKFCTNCGVILDSAEPEPAAVPLDPVCPGCGGPVDPKLPFCCNCGCYLGGEAPAQPEPQVPVCPNCDTPLESESQRFCTCCGADLMPAGSTPEPAHIPTLEPVRGEPEPVRMPEPEPEPEYIPVPPAPAPRPPKPAAPETPVQESAPAFKSTFKKR